MFVQILKYLAVALTSGLIFMSVALKHLNTPIVQFSHSTGKCVKVIPETAGDCNNLPTKYHNEITQ